jgi:hypothetical protein
METRLRWWSIFFHAVRCTATRALSLHDPLSPPLSDGEPRRGDAQLREAARKRGGSDAGGGGGGKAGAKRATVKEECPKCKHPFMEFYTMQLRSADEGQTVFYECPAATCGHKFSINT